MATTSASIQKLVPVILLLFATLLVTTAFAKSARLVAKLIHRDSIDSPYYNPNATVTDRANRELNNSIARFAYLVGANTTSENDYRAGVFAVDSYPIFLANISIGDPPMVQLLLMDTGSNLLWFQCLPCTQCYQQSVPIFDPSKSSTYANLSCHSPYCFQDKCDPSDHCVYNTGYLDGSTTTGNLAFEKLTFVTSDEGITNISNILVGCGHNNVDYTARHSGVLGLGPQDDISLVFRLGQKFSYCIGDINDPHYNFNNLILGDGAKIEGNLSPMELYGGHYYVALEGISVGVKRLDIDPNIFKRSLDTGDGGVIIDSGMTLSFLAPGAYEPFNNEVHNLLHGGFERVTDPSDEFHYCYIGNVKDIKGFPPVTFYFAGGAVLEMDVNNIFFQTDTGKFCLSVLGNPRSNRASIIGAMLQQFHNIGYDLVEKTITFLKIDCQLLEY